ncbi:VOC family protein [Almyronema epifaneia]|uniref:VOC family protein n=1 Tax=Almyronema epifaneia S1 TaxID=2991925 RepID=A0ABW6IBQ3_9CYAN
MIQVIRPLHVAVLVSDLAKAEAFYGDLLGLPQVERSLNFSGTWYQVGEVQIHLILAETPPSTLVNPQKWGRNPHLVLAIADLQTAQSALNAAGLPYQLSASGRAALFVRDPDGNIVELSQA